MDALVVLAFLVGLALVAPRWGWDSRDGVESPEWRRRAAWLGGSAVDRERRDWSSGLDRRSTIRAEGRDLGDPRPVCRPALGGA
jgi:hypothetical protein